MFKNVNNRIYMTKGDTPTYDSSILYRDGSPFRIDRSIENPRIEFVVRSGVHSKDSDISIKYHFVADEYVFDTETIQIYSGEVFDDLIPPEDTTAKILYRAGDDNYAYWGKINDEDEEEEKHWITYNARFSFPFDRGSTQKLEPKTYYYQINLLGGELADPESTKHFSKITYKRTLLDTNEFIVGGSLSE